MSTSFYCPGERRGPDGRLEFECNFSSYNAVHILRLIGESTHESGYWKAEDLSRVQRRIIRAINIQSERAPFIEEPRDEHGVSWGGCSDEQLLRRLRKLQALVKHAQDNSLQILWS